jgi:hypothetical protein
VVIDDQFDEIIIMHLYGQLIVTNERISVKRWRCSEADG